MRPDIDLRSYLDTRGAAILLVLSGLALLGFAALGGLLVPAVVPDGIPDVEMTVIVLSLPLGLIIPVVAVMMTAGEWSDRSIQVTLLQRPGRQAVLASKTISAVALVTALVVLTFLLAALATWLGGVLTGKDANFASWDGVLTTQLAVLAATLVFSLAMGILLQSTVLGLIAAIGVPFVTATASGIAMATGSELFSDVMRALDLQSAATRLGNGNATAFELIPLALLVIAPIVAGAWRWNRREVG